MSASDAAPHTLARRWCFAAVATSVVVVAGECWRWANAERRLFALFGVLAGEQPDWLPYLPWLAAAMYWCWRSAPISAEPTAGPGIRTAAPSRWTLGTILLCLCVGGLALGMSLRVASHFRTADGRPFPPAYHDEYSYLFQAQTFLAGRTWFPSFEPRPELFDQMHVLNLGRFASRYFPGVGVWLAPWVWLQNPWLGQALAQGLCAMLLVAIGIELRGLVCGLTAGTLCALSPGLTLFSTLLVAHHPTLLGLLTFLWAFLRLMRRPTPWCGLLAGAGLSYAMLCRPMTAAGFALPFGIWTLWYLASGGRRPPQSAIALDPHPAEPPTSSGGRRPPSLVVASLALPLLAGFALLLWYSWTITGDPWLSPYQQYTDAYTPRHVYGFNNVLRGASHPGPHVVRNYDEWAVNLTPGLAAANTWRRLLASLRLTLGIVPILFALVWLSSSIAVSFQRGRPPRLDGPVALIAASILSLFAVHVPYWFVGIMEWHYVLEASPLWLLLAGVVTHDLSTWSRAGGGRGPLGLWLGLLATAVAVNACHVPLTSDADGTWWLWRGRLPQLMSEVGFARGRYEQVREQVEQLRRGRRSVLLVIPDPADRSLDYVTNEPSLTADVLRVRVPPGEADPASLRRIAALFPDRLPVVFDVAQGRMSVLDRP